jgi:hypothetical protein
VAKGQVVADTLAAIGLIRTTPRWENLIDGQPMQRLQRLQGGGAVQ